MTYPRPDAYVRQRALTGFGDAGQTALSRARVAIVGVGGIGCPAAIYLAAAGVGQLTIIDPDHVSVTNLHRQVLYGAGDVGLPKAQTAAAAIRRMSPDSEVSAVPCAVTSANAMGLLAGHDVIVDGTDTFAARFVVADAGVELGIPVAWGAVLGWDGHVTVFDSLVTLRDLHPAEPAGDIASCESSAVLGTLCGQVGSAVATEAVKIITGMGQPLVGRIASIDARTGRWREVELLPAPASAPSQESESVAVG
ncbi:MAG: hypothetical protein CVT64_04885 [Actinobacteria bacterium HGW-Actinobacteria-4]|nr:MAG: hypothetical protein CVT64_04885 [Actinobacteria bacterium HGW-Actinobacteria-4]